MAGFGVRAKRAPRGTAEDPVYTTLEQIVDRIGHIASRKTVDEWADPEGRDPLRIRHRCGLPWIQESVLAAWLVRTDGTAEEKAALPKVRGKEAICKAFGRDWRTILRYAALPADPLPIEGGEEPWIYRSALVDWVNAHDVPRAVHLSGWSWQGPPTTREDVCPPVPAKKEEAA